MQPSCSVHTDKIVVHIPPLSAPFYLANQAETPSNDPMEFTKSLSPADGHPSDSGFADVGSELITPLSPFGQVPAQTCEQSNKLSPQPKHQFRLQTIATSSTTTTSSDNSVIIPKQANPDCVPLFTTPYVKIMNPVITSLSAQSDPTSLVTFLCAGSNAHTWPFIPFYSVLRIRRRNNASKCSQIAGKMNTYYELRWNIGF